MSAVDTSAEAVERLTEMLAGHPWVRVRDAAATLRALAADRDAGRLREAEAVVATNNAHRERMQAEREARAAEAGRNRLAAENARMRELLARCDEEMRLIRMKDTGALYDIGLRAERRPHRRHLMTDANGWPEEAREAAKRALEWGQMNADGSTDDDDWVERILGSLAPFVASRAATAAQAMREACARRVDDDGIGDPRERQLRAYLAGQVRALPIPAPDALAREIAAAED